jgi:hypothetical protein
MHAATIRALETGWNQMTRPVPRGCYEYLLYARKQGAPAGSPP